MGFTVRDIAEKIGAPYEGDSDFVVERAANPAASGPDDLALAMDKSYIEALEKSGSKAAVLWPGADWQALGLDAAIFVSRPRFAMAAITRSFDRPPGLKPGVDRLAVVDDTAKIGRNVSIGAFTTIGAGAIIGDNARIMDQVTIAENVELGANALVYSGSRIGSFVKIGTGFIAHYNSVIGSDGFSFVTPEPSAAEQARQEFKADGSAKPQSYHRIYSNASVILGDNIEIGASSTIDKGTVAPTVVGSGTKIDNHVQIGHNVQVGRDCLLCAHAAIAGSSILGDRVILGGQAGVGDHLILGNDVIAAGATAILSNVPAGRVVMGYPAVKMEQNIESYKALRRLPRWIKRIEALEKQVSKSPGKS